MNDFETSEPYKTPTSAPGEVAGSMPSSEERNWALAAHLVPLIAWGFPFGNIVAPAVVWFLKKEEMPFVDDQAREALNFQITMTLAGIVCGILVLFVIGIPLAIALFIYDIVATILAAKACSEGRRYRYTICLRLV